ncbi:kinesin-like protein KIF11 [Lycorma delicatula]|uniref:kinesin-like protein KIF11 n=1 Tax=Lycorma delicatula TaxID=130591 RepID=UPI003F5104A9
MSNIEANVQVYVRIRHHEEMGTLKKYKSILNTARNKEILISDKNSDKHFRTFTFDKVLDADVSQADVFRTAMSPLIEDVLAGYNCTVFAYGQSGSGKTYTMVGEKSLMNMDLDKDPKSGLIPKSLGKLFDKLNSLNTEYAVRVSFLEIYNEELIDLLACSDEESRLKLYEDTVNKGGVIVYGLEEVVVHDKSSAFNVFEKGCAKQDRFMESLNSHISRYHSIFTITVYLKETPDLGEEFLIVGKLNLVDLAGSDNVSRSGAMDKHARETGRINQSMLTLNRVIMSLADHTNHIPYRESKLTRLLQDSLGGSSKTCVIATVSPLAIHFEETLNTLEYINLAKNIVNKPQVNKKLFEKNQLKKYTEEIERLQKDLIANRVKEGIFLADDTYDKLMSKINIIEQEKQDLIMTIKAIKIEMKKMEETMEVLNRHKQEMIKVVATQDSLFNKLHNKIEKLENSEDINHQKVQSHQTNFTENLLNIRQSIFNVIDEVSSFLAGCEQLVDVSERKIEIAGANMCFQVQSRIKTLLDQLYHNFIENIQPQIISRTNDLTNLDTGYQIGNLIQESLSRISDLLNQFLEVIVPVIDENEQLENDIEQDETVYQDKLDLLQCIVENEIKSVLEMENEFLKNVKVTDKLISCAKENLHKKELIQSDSISIDSQKNDELGRSVLKEMQNLNSIFINLSKDVNIIQNEDNTFLSSIDNVNNLVENASEKVSNTVNKYKTTLKQLDSDCTALKRDFISKFVKIEQNIEKFDQEVTNNSSSLFDGIYCTRDVTEDVLDEQKKFETFVQNTVTAHDEISEKFKGIISDNAKLMDNQKTDLESHIKHQKDILSNFIYYLKDDTSTGATPQRQEYNYQQQLKGTSPIERLRSKFRSRMQDAL